MIAGRQQTARDAGNRGARQCEVPRRARHAAKRARAAIVWPPDGWAASDRRATLAARGGGATHRTQPGARNGPTHRARRSDHRSDVTHGATYPEEQRWPGPSIASAWSGSWRPSSRGSRRPTRRRAGSASARRARCSTACPMNWMIKWAGAVPAVRGGGAGAHFTDVDGHEYVDFCLGDTGAMAGHGPDADDRARSSARCGAGSPTCSRPRTRSSAGEELQPPVRRCRCWQFTLTATDANRFAIRLARHITGRSKVLVHDHCYHGSVDETFATLGADGSRRGRGAGNIGPPVDPGRDDAGRASSTTSRRLERELGARRRRGRPVRAGADERRDRAARARATTRPSASSPAGTGTLLIIDETHTICAGPGRLHGARTASSRTSLDDRQDDRRRDPGGRLRDDRGGRRRGSARRSTARTRRRRDRRDAGRLRAVAGGDPGDARRGPDRRGVRADDPARRALGGRRQRRASGRGACRGTSPGSAPGPSTTSCPTRRATAPSRRPTPTPSSSGSSTLGDEPRAC